MQKLLRTFPRYRTLHKSPSVQPLVLLVRAAAAQLGSRLMDLLGKLAEDVQQHNDADESEAQHKHTVRAPVATTSTHTGVRVRWGTATSKVRTAGSPATPRRARKQKRGRRWSAGRECCGHQANQNATDTCTAKKQ